MDGGPEEGLPLGFLHFRLSYYNGAGDSLSIPPPLGAVRQVRVDATLESTVPYDTTYARTFVRFRVRPKNLDL